MHLPLEGEFELGANTVRATDQDRLAKAFGDLKQSAKTADSSQHALTHSFLGKWLDAFNQGITRIDVNASILVGQSAGGNSGGSHVGFNPDEWGGVNDRAVRRIFLNAQAR
jgi:hypothetical protein